MNKQQEREELTAIITAQQKLELLHTWLAKGVNRTLNLRRDAWMTVSQLAYRNLDFLEREITSKSKANEQPAEQPK